MHLVTVHGNAKINLTLDILGTRPDGFHEVAMVMQSLALHDTVEMERTDGGISLELLAEDIYGGDTLEADESNLAWRAAALMQAEYGLRGGVRMRLVKRIPIAAGLAGGSTDAAAVLRGMSELYELGLSERDLCRQGEKLGSDIPFCIMGGTMLSTGRGEVLERLPSLPELPVVLAKPRIAVSTAWAYRTYDAVGADRHPDNEAIQKEIVRGDWKAVSSLLCNVLERVTIKKYEIIADYEQLMLEHGAMASMMSGSGPTVFGLAESKERAQAVADVLRKETDAEIFVTHTVGKRV